jgi:hypothetical protein
MTAGRGIWDSADGPELEDHAWKSGRWMLSSELRIVCRKIAAFADRIATKINVPSDSAVARRGTVGYD